MTAGKQWHKELAGIAGELSLRLVRGKVTPALLLHWAAVLASIEGEMRGMAEKGLPASRIDAPDSRSNAFSGPF